MDKAGQATRSVSKEVSVLDKQFAQLGSLVAGAFAVGSVVQFGKAVYDVSNQVKSLEIRMEQLQGSTDGADRAFGMLIQLSKQLGVNMIDLTQNYTQFVSAAKASGIEVAKAEKIFTNMSIALKGAGVSAEGGKRALIAITQMMAKGRISAEELSGQLAESGLSGSIGYMAKSLGVGTKELLKMMEQGKLTSDALLGFSQVARDEVGGSISEMSKSAEANVARLTNSWEAYMTSLAERFYGSGGGAAVLADMLEAWVEINESQEQYLQRRRRILLGDAEEQQQAQKMIDSLKNQKKSNEEINKEIEAKIQNLKDEALGYKMINGFQFQTQQLTDAEKIERYNLIKALQAELKIINDIGNGNKKLSDAELKALEKRRLETIRVAREMAKALKDVYKFDGKIELDPFEQGATDAKRRRRQQEQTDEEVAAEASKKLALAKSEAEIKVIKDNLKKKEEIDLQKREMAKQNEIDLYRGLTSLANSYYQRDLAKQTEALQKRLEVGAISEEQYAKALRKIKRKEAIADRIAALSQIAISTAVNIASPQNALALGAFTPFYLTNAAIQAGIVIAQPMPYNKGTKRVPMMRGAIRGRDSVHAILTPDERVVPADINSQPGYSALLDLAQDKKISDKEAGMIASIATGGRSGNNQVSFDPDELGKSIAKHIPHTNVSINDRGIAVITERSQSEIRRLRTRL